ALTSACGSKKDADNPDAAVEDEISAMDQGSTDNVPKDAVETPGAENAATTPPTDAPTDATIAEPVGGSEMAGSGQFDTYAVKSGDTLMKIAFEYYGDLTQWKKIYAANQGKLKDPNMIPAGTHLKVERPATPVMVERNGTPFKVRPGDTLGTIASEVYGNKGKWKKIWHNNKQLIHDPNKIYAGFYVYYTTSPEDQPVSPLGAAPTQTGKTRAPASMPAGGGTAPAPGTPPAGN
ncbi:MAG TPA: LysM peptidoglycan-binding domain-containing protein, partial [Bdellovibrionota bacterium]|nr:LysM peptidoglycan-binding domain-containing protein [Bdellovibrionota bacterium]